MSGIFKANKTNIDRQQRMKHILNVAEDIIHKTKEYKDTHPIFLLIKALVNIEMYSNIYALISSKDEYRVKEYSFYDILPLDSNQYGRYIYKNSDKIIDAYGLMKNSKLKTHDIVIRLGYDSIITEPWNLDRFTDAISIIAENEEWKQQKNNHYIALHLPYGVSFIAVSGNHSITKGFLANIGNVIPEEVYNVSIAHDFLYTDGVYYYRKIDNSIYANVNNFNLAVVFEIGSLICKYAYEKNIRFHSKIVLDYI